MVYPLGRAMAFDLTFSRLYVLRDRVALINDQIGKATAARTHALFLPWHSDDIAERLLAGINTVVSDFELRLGECLDDPQADVAEVLNDGAAVYFMRDLLTGKVPALVGRLCPGAERGTKRADRQAVLDASIAQLRRLFDERDEVRKALSMELASLREAHHQALSADDWQAQCEIEREERLLNEDIAAIRKAQEGQSKLLSVARLG